MKINKHSSKIVKLIIISVIIITIVLYTSIYFKGLKNVDLVYNYQNFVIGQYETNSSNIWKNIYDATDFGSDEVTRPLYVYYGWGLNQMQRAFFINMVLMLVLGLMMRDIIEK